MPGVPTPESIRQSFTTYVDGDRPTRDSKYDDIDEIVALENAGLVISGLEDLVLNPLTNQVLIPSAISVASPLTGKIITVSAATINNIYDGATLYIDGSNFPIQTGTKTITARVLSNKKYRRTDMLIIGVRIGSALYLRHGIVRGEEAAGIQIFEAYIAISVAGIAGTYQSIPWTTYGEKTPAFDHSTTVDSENVGINFNGTYVIEWRLTTQAIGGTMEVTSKLQCDQGWGFSDVLNTQAYTRHDVNMSKSTINVKTIVRANTGYVYRIQAKISSAIVGGETATALNSASAVSIFKL